jgi:hypothetical protein
MSFKRLDPEDFVISADAVSSTLWSTNSPALPIFFTSSAQVDLVNGNYYIDVYQTASSISGSEVQFSIAYGNQYGSGSVLYNSTYTSASYSRTIYGQYRTLVLGDENSNFIFGNYTASEFHAISFDRSRYKESLLPGSLTLTISGSGATIRLTDDSQVTSTVTFLDSGRVYQLVSGSAGAVNTTKNANGYTAGSGSYGYLLPDIGVILLNSKALASPASNGGTGLSNLTASLGNTNQNLPVNLWTAISGGASFTVNSQETITSDYVFVRVRNSEFNYTENPSFISGSTGDIIYTDFINNPVTYVTTVGMYNDNNELLAVAKLSKPLQKDFTKEALVRVKLDF